MSVPKDQCPIPWGQEKVTVEPITNIHRFIGRASELFMQDKRLQREFILSMEAEAKRMHARRDVWDMRRINPIGTIAGVLRSFKQGCDWRGYKVYTHAEPEVAHIREGWLAEVSGVSPIVPPAPSGLGALLRRKPQPDDRFVFDTNPSDDIVIVETFSTFPRENPLVLRDGSRYDMKRYNWIHQFRAYRATDEGVVPLGKRLTMITGEDIDVQYLVSDIDLEAVTPADQISVHVSLPRCLQRQAN